MSRKETRFSNRSVLEISAIMHNMRYVRDEVSNHSGGNKYGFVNYKFCNFDDDGKVSRFHIEMRQTDGILSPTIIAALACLHYALVIKAVEISKEIFPDKKILDDSVDLMKYTGGSYAGYDDIKMVIIL